jgi:hypothetical protein
VFISCAYWLVRHVLGLAVLRCRSDAANEVEILVLRHELAVLRRQVARPSCRPTDRVLLVALARMLPRERWGSVFVRSETVRRWHRALLARRWTYPHRRPGRPSTDADVTALIVRLARENTSSASSRSTSSITTRIARTAPSNSDRQPGARNRTHRPSSHSTGFDVTTSSEDSSTNTRAPHDDGRIEFPAPTGCSARGRASRTPRASAQVRLCGAAVEECSSLRHMSASQPASPTPHELVSSGRIDASRGSRGAVRRWLAACPELPALESVRGRPLQPSGRW